MLTMDLRTRVCLSILLVWRPAKEANECSNDVGATGNFQVSIIDIWSNCPLKCEEVDVSLSCTFLFYYLQTLLCQAIFTLGIELSSFIHYHYHSFTIIIISIKISVTFSGKLLR